MRPGDYSDSSVRANFSAASMESRDGREMTSILRACVHCGFCNATCPTYQVTGDELDGPRGRIYLIKSMLEGERVGEATQTHLDRCLTCRSCETTCPSGVQYSRLLDLARPSVENEVGRTPLGRFKRWLIRHIVPYPQRFATLAVVGRWFTPILPSALAELIPAAPKKVREATLKGHARRMLLLDGCVQQAAAPSINAAAREVFGRLKVDLVAPASAGCCGAVAYHLGDVTGAENAARRNIDAWTDGLAQGAEAIVSTSSGCAMMLREYAGLLAGDPAYAARAKQVTAAVCDPSEVIDPQELARAYRVADASPIAFQQPCTLQHGLRVADKTAACLTAVGFELAEVPDSHLCCGSAGSYSLLEPAIANELLDKKLAALETAKPSTIVSANIGCLMHLKRRSTIDVVHWLELVQANPVANSE